MKKVRVVMLLLAVFLAWCFISRIIVVLAFVGLCWLAIEVIVHWKDVDSFFNQAKKNRGI
jgi:hypothetical protein